MRSLWSRGEKDKGESKREAEAALASAREDLQTIRDQSPEVTQLVKALKDFRERNHLGEALEAMILQVKGPHHDSGH